jgi:hypothetical protein
MTGVDKIKEEMARIYAQLDKEDTHFLEGVMLVMPSEEGKVGIACCNMKSEEMYEMLTSTAAAVIEDLGNAPSTYTSQ